MTANEGAGRGGPPEGKPLLKAIRVNHSFTDARGKPNQVLFNVDLVVWPGDVVILEGISGCGKTTLLTLIGGLRKVQGRPAALGPGDDPLDGPGPEILIWNDERRDYDGLVGLAEADLVELRQRIGFIFQRHNLFDSLTAAENVRMAQQLRPRDDDADWPRLKAAVEAAELDPLAPSQELTAALLGELRRAEADASVPLADRLGGTRLGAILAAGGRLQPRALVLPLDTTAEDEAWLEANAWELEPRQLPLPCPTDPGMRARLENRGYRIDPDRNALRLPDKLHDGDWMVLAELGLRFGGRRLPLLGGDLDARLPALRERFGGKDRVRIEPERLLLPSPPDREIDALLTKIGLSSVEHSLRFPPYKALPERLKPLVTRRSDDPDDNQYDLPKRLQTLLGGLRLHFHQGTLALPHNADVAEDDIAFPDPDDPDGTLALPDTADAAPAAGSRNPKFVTLLKDLRLTAVAEDRHLRFGPASSIFAIRLLKSLRVPVERTERDGRFDYSIPLPRTGSAEEAREQQEAVLDLGALWGVLAYEAKPIDKIDQRPVQLSGGQRQRVAICRALINRPLLILADEPTAALDASRKLQVIQMLKARAILNGTTSVIVTHDEEITRYADRIVRMEQGRITANIVVAEREFLYHALRRSDLFGTLPTDVQLELTAELLLGFKPDEDVPAEYQKRAPWFQVHRKGDRIVRQGEPGDRAYLIRRGTVEIWRGDETTETGPDGQRRVVVGEERPVLHTRGPLVGRPVTRGPGDVFGDQAVLTGDPRNATVVAVSDEVETYAITERRFAPYRDETLKRIQLTVDVYGRQLGGRPAG